MLVCAQGGLNILVSEKLGEPGMFHTPVAPNRVGTDPERIHSAIALLPCFLSMPAWAENTTAGQRTRETCLVNREVLQA